MSAVLSAFGGEADIRGSRCLLWSGANDPSATSTGLKFRSVAVACAISSVPKRGKALSSETAHGHQALDRLFSRKTTVGAPNQRRRSFVEWFPASALVQTRHESGGPASPMHTSKENIMACRLATAFAAATIGISCIAASDASAACKFKAKKDIIVIVDVGHSDRDLGQISARGIKEYDLNLKLAGRVLEELVHTGFVSTQMIVTSGPNTHESRLRRSKRANDLGADLFISVHHDGVKNETLMPWQYNGKTHWFLDKFEGFSLWVSKKNNKYEET